MSKQQASVDVLEGNKIISEFMGKQLVETPWPHAPINDQGQWIMDENGIFKVPVKYHSSWDWLMPLVQKIERMKGVHCVISELGCDIYYFGKHISNCREETKILTVFQAVVQFIVWHNNTQTKKQ